MPGEFTTYSAMSLNGARTHGMRTIVAPLPMAQFGLSLQIIAAKLAQAKVCCGDLAGWRSVVATGGYFVWIAADFELCEIFR